MKMVSTSLFSGKNRAAVIDASLDVTNRGPYQTIPDTEILQRPGGTHVLKLLILSDTGCTNSVRSDSLFECFTPSLIGSRNINVTNFGGTTNVGADQYKFYLPKKKQNPLL